MQATTLHEIGGNSISRPAARPWELPSTLVLLGLLLLAISAANAAFDSEVEAVQRALTERGYDPGTIDHAIGWRTRGALREFRRSAGISDTGRIDDATRTTLGLAPRDGTKRLPAGGTDSTGTDDTARTEPAAAPQAPARKTEATKVESTPVRAPRPKLDFATLGWHRPQTGAQAQARFNAIGAPPEFRRGKGTLFVPKGELVFVLKAGERFPGLDCDPGAGRLSIEFVFGPDGPVIFTPAKGGDFCQTGIGIAIEVGRTLEIRRIDWGDMQLPPGTVRVTGEGLEYIR